MKTLVILAHPNIEKSSVNRIWAELLKTDSDITVHELYKIYPNKKIDVKAEQSLLMEHDRIIFQFPMFWYSSPSLLKQWEDEVLLHGFAYGTDGNKLEGKEMMLAFSTGSNAMAYTPNGQHAITLEELTSPFRTLARLCGMVYLPYFTLQGWENFTPEKVKESAVVLLHKIKERS